MQQAEMDSFRYIDPNFNYRYLIWQFCWI